MLYCIKCQFVLQEHYKKCPFCNKTRKMVAKNNMRLTFAKFSKNPSAYNYSCMEAAMLKYQEEVKI